MAKRKITVTVDADLVAAIRSEQGETLSAVVNAALVEEVDRRARRTALGRLLAEWDAAAGPVSAEAAALASAAFDELDVNATNVA
jgi:hypothetical protein